MKKILIGKTGSDKSKRCFEIAEKYNGTVVYMNGTDNAESYYEKYGVRNDFIVTAQDKTLNFENGKKYFMVPGKETTRGEISAPRKRSLFVSKRADKTTTSYPQYYKLPVSDAVSLFAEDIKNIYIEKIISPVLLLMDDGYWEGAKERQALLLWKLSHSDRDIVITVASEEDLLNVKLSVEMKDDLSKYWEIEYL